MKALEFRTVTFLLISIRIAQAEDPISIDGVSWIQRHQAKQKGGGAAAICYGNSQFIAVGSNGTAQTSADGLTWVQREIGIPNVYLRGIAYGNNQIVAVGLHGAIVTTADGVNWVQRQVRFGGYNDLRSIAYGNGRLVAVGGGIILTSSDGVNWVHAPQNEYLASVVYGNGQFVAVGDRTVVISADGVSWSRRQSPTQNPLNAITGR